LNKAIEEAKQESKVNELVENLQGDIREMHGLDREWTPRINKRD